MYTQEAVIFYLSAYSSDRRLEKGSFYIKITSIYYLSVVPQLRIENMLLN
jgi:hypothetical protein